MIINCYHLFNADRRLLGIASKFLDILLYPAESEALVAEAEIKQPAVLECFAAQETERCEAVAAIEE
jgi:hypothetical protein